MSLPASSCVRAYPCFALLCGASALAVMAGCSGGSGSSSEGQARASTAASPAGAAAVPLEKAYVNVVRAVLPSVARIRTSVGLGSGVVFDTRGDIVTNAHVVGSSTSFQVTLPNASKPLSATLVGTYPPDDLAVIRVQGASGLHPAAFGDSAGLQVGDIVLAMGNPLGLSSSVTNGIVSAVGRTVSEPQSADSPGATLPNVIQTSAAINPGNSGGALVDLAGHVVGIPTLAAIDPAQGASAGGAAPGIGFAIPSSIVTDIARQLIATGHVTDSHRAALGVTVTGVVDAAGNPAGVGIVSVSRGGAADKAGLQAGEIITSVAGQQTPDPAGLAQVLAKLRPGQRVPITAAAPGTSPQTTQVTLGQLPG